MKHREYSVLFIIILLFGIVSIVESAPAAPVAAFNASPQFGTAPLIVTFVDESTDSPTGWAWYFGDETFTTALWEPMNLSAAWAARSNQTSVAMPDGSIVMMGGKNVTVSFEGTYRSTDNGTNWALVNASAGWSGRFGQSSVALPNGNIVMMGGFDNNLKNDTWLSTDNGGNWSLANENSGWLARFGHSSVAMPNGNIVLMAGSGNSSFMNDTWLSTDNGTSWTELNPAAGWTARSGQNSVVMPDGSIVLMGGFDGVYRNDTWRSIDNGTTWNQMTPAAGWSARFGQSSVAMPDGSIVLMGGFDGVYRNDTWRSTDNGTTWTQLTSGLWTERSGQSVVALPDGGIVLMGGNNGTDYMNDVWRFQTAGSLAEDPSHTYASSGTYSVALQAYNAGGYNSTLKSGYIVVTSDASPPASVTNLTNATYNQTFINWSWSDPTDLDFANVSVYLNNTFKANVTKGTQFYNTTGLLADSDYLLSTRTVDTSGNLNNTWVNSTARTAPVSSPDSTPPASITNLANITFQPNFINWSWSDPTDLDLANVSVYLNNTFKANVTKGTQFYNTTGLLADSDYLLSTRTVDTSGNLNNTWVNSTARTAPVSSPDSTPPASITNLANITFQPTFINWSWSDPTDLDFANVSVYLNNTFKTNVTKGTQFYNTTGLLADSDYLLSTRTVDTSGNLNNTWVNSTARTAPLSESDITPPASVTNLTNNSYQPTFINWSWSDPTDLDFANVSVYLNNTFKANVTKGTQFYNTTGLVAASDYLLSTRTVDATGNINASWVNVTARTAPLSESDITPPASVTNLINTTFQPTFINWSWSDPTDSDFANVSVYLNNTFKANVTKGTQFYNTTGLVADSDYLLSTRTVDTSGNLNNTWVNSTARTAPVSSPDSTPPARITNLANITFQPTFINWSWSDPTDSDFANVSVYLNNTFKANVTKGTQFYNTTGLVAASDYLLSTRTVDATGNINASWVNVTARTAPLSESDITPPASVTNLINTTFQPTFINWSWSDPTDSDFANVSVYLNNTFKANVTKGTQFYNTTGLVADSDYLLSTRTVDTSGNLNNTWVNSTARTAPVSSPDSTPPASITNLANTTFQPTFINWSWSDPTDSDFANVSVYLNNTFKANVTKGTQFYNTTGLVADSDYLLSTRTVDAIGNINASWVNLTARTAPLSESDITPPASVTNLINTTFQPTFINWSWSDPTDLDFSNVSVYLNNTFKTNVTKGAGFYNATLLTQDTQYNLSTRTVDSSGNVNNTWVNSSARTSLQSASDTTPPGSITNLTNTTFQPTSITWTWTDSTTPDFDYVAVYLDGVWRTNVTKGTQYYHAITLSPDTQYSLGTRTVDTAGNVNTTWVNSTSRTALAQIPSGDTTPPMGVMNLANTTYQQNYINWVWTDPTDSDFDHTVVYLNGLYQNSVLKGVQGYNATGLNPDSVYTLSIGTVDNNWNYNLTFVTNTSKTAPALPTPTPTITPTTVPTTIVTTTVPTTNVTTTVPTTVVTTAVPVNGTPGSVTNLKNTTYQADYIIWTWTDPVDGDFHHTVVYLNGLYQNSVLKGVQGYNATGLNPDSVYTLSVGTVDNDWNYNLNLVTNTSKTAPVLPSPTPTGVPTTVPTSIVTTTVPTTAVPTTIPTTIATTAVPVNEPPGSVTNLKNTTYQANYIIWTWTDPVDGDFHHTVVYLNGLYQNSVLKGTQFYNATGLYPDSAYTLSVGTVDNDSKYNLTFVSNTANTAPVIPLPTPTTTPTTVPTTSTTTTIPSTMVTTTVPTTVPTTVVTTVVPVNDPPASVTNLQNTTYQQDYIIWTWIDPVDSDFHHTVVYLNGLYQNSVLKGTQFYNATGLYPDSVYTLSVGTVDNDSKYNLTFVSNTANTAPVIPLPTPTTTPTTVPTTSTTTTIPSTMVTTTVPTTVPSTSATTVIPTTEVTTTVPTTVPTTVDTTVVPTTTGPFDSVWEAYFTTTPQGAVIFLDGTRIERVTPVYIKVPVGTHQVIFKREGYNDLQKTFEVKSNYRTTVSGRLIPGSGSVIPTQPVPTITTVPTITPTIIPTSSGGGLFYFPPWASRFIQLFPWKWGL